MNLDDVAVALGNAVKTNVSGVRKAFDFVPDSITPPAVIVAMADGTYDEDMDGGQTVNWAVLIVTGRTNVKTAQTTLRNYAATSGSKSIKAAIELDPTLAGTVGSAVVKGWEEPQELEIANIKYIALPFIVETID